MSTLKKPTIGGRKFTSPQGYSVVSSEAALELNQWLRSKMEAHPNHQSH
jgi:hypothetical protein